MSARAAHGVTACRARRRRRTHRDCRLARGEGGGVAMRMLADVEH
ncbi:hypothetical protein BURMUCF2_A2255 [Burkholderia multivorans CF2]|nr:hypothetical protein BURMUCF2_A2255 [Burkholderia multivorans CF2]